jgi:hypothetical protein
MHSVSLFGRLNPISKQSETLNPELGQSGIRILNLGAASSRESFKRQ